MQKRYAQPSWPDAKGRKCYRIPVVMIFNNSSGPVEGWLNPRKLEFTVIAHSAAEAANWARDNESGNMPETEIIAWGPKGGETRRYIGWQLAVYMEMMQPKPPENLTLF